MKLTPPLSTKVDSQSWMLWHKDLGNYLNLSNSVKSHAIENIQNKLNYTIIGASMTIQYYGPSSTTENEIKIALPVQCRNRSMIDMYYSDGSSTAIVIEADSRFFTIPVNTKDLEDKSVHIQGNIFIVT